MNISTSRLITDANSGMLITLMTPVTVSDDDSLRRSSRAEARDSGGVVSNSRLRALSQVKQGVNRSLEVEPRLRTQDGD